MKDISQVDIENNVPLATRSEFRRNLRIGNVPIGGDDIVVIAGPCTIESRTQIMQVAREVKEAGANALRGGAFKPLTFPYGDPLAQPDSDSDEPRRDRMLVLSKHEQLQAAERRLGYLKEAGAKYGLPVISEILYADTVAMMEEYVDMFQVGYRHMFNMDLIHALSRATKPIMLKRHYGESHRSLLGVAEHLDARGKTDYVVCERGVSVPHTHQTEARAILDVQGIVAFKNYAPSIPIFADPSHATFNRGYVAPMASAAIAAGADGVIVEVHNDPINAWVDPLQAVGVGELPRMVETWRAIRRTIREGM
jgi:3-deoxy-7-phosphoheptulonate synthase